MVLAALLATNLLPEQLLLCVDALLYCSGAVLVAAFNADACRAAIIYLALCVAVNSPRHINAMRAACNQDATSEGQLRRLPAAVTASEAGSRRRTAWPWLPTAALLVAAALPWPLAPCLALVAAETHFVVARVHGDCRGGKPAITLFVLMLHCAAALSGADPLLTLSLHRLLVTWTYFLTGLRKLYCAGLRWCDGKNLALMLGIQGLYHDAGANGLGWNFLLARRVALCRLASVAVVALQLSMPLCLLVDHPAAMPLGFAFAMSFHASNHVLWRINFFVAWCPALLALLAPAPQLPAVALVAAAARNQGGAAPSAVLAVYLTLQLGHALDLASEKLLAACRRWLLPVAGWLVVRPLLGLIWLLEMHCLGDYYSSYWPTSHPLRAAPVACLVAVYDDGTECLLPATVDFYWRRDMSSGVKWPRRTDDPCDVKRWDGWSDAKGNTGALRGATAVNAQMAAASRPVSDVLATLQRQLEETFLGRARLRRLITRRPAPGGSRGGGGGGGGGAVQRIVLRARQLETPNGVLVPRTLWECSLAHPW